MRKSASTANTGISSFFGTSPHHHFTTIPETEDQQDRGLTMSARPNNNVLAAAKDVQQQQKVIVANTNHTGSAAPAAAVAASPPHKTVKTTAREKVTFLKIIQFLGYLWKRVLVQTGSEQPGGELSLHNGVGSLKAKKRDVSDS